MEPQQITTDVMLEKYAKTSEHTADDIYMRVSKGIAINETNSSYWTKVFYDNMKSGAIGAGRIMSAAGTGIDATLINCFVQPVGDCISGFDDEMNPGIYNAITNSAETMRRGGGVGYDFSLIRPKNAKVGNFGAMASGPCSYMNIFDQSCETIESAGARRGAQMGILRIDHPDIIEFITAKRTDKRWNNFNVSVFVTDYFMGIKDDPDAIFELVHKATPSEQLIEEGAYQKSDGIWVYRTIKACDLWDTIMKSNYDFAEPGILFSDNINKDNNLRYCEKITATNPCAEQPLPPYGCCDLGPIILPMFVKNPFTHDAYFDYNKFKDAVSVQVRFLDNVLDVTLWPLSQQQEEAQNKRRIGIGFTGLANALAMLNVSYVDENGLEIARYISEVMRDAAYTSSVNLAIERGSFPLFDADSYLEEGTFASRLPDTIKDLIRAHGIRNSHLLSIAPTGTVSLAFADNASNGIEPPFSLAYTRAKRMPDGSKKHYNVIDHSLRVYLNTLSDQQLAQQLLSAICSNESNITYHGIVTSVKQFLPKNMITAMDMTVDQHTKILEVVQPYIDTSISKTVNVPADYPLEDFKKIYDNAWKANLKGISTYRPNSIIGSVLSVLPKEESKKEEGIQMSAEISNDLFNEFIPKRPVGKLHSLTNKVEYLSSSFVNDSFYVGVSFLKDIKRPIEVFFTVCPDGVPQEWLDAYAINLSLLARGGLDVFCKALRALRKVKSDKGQVRYGWYTKTDGNKVPLFHSSEVACMAFAIQEILIEEGIIDELGFPKKQEVAKDTIANLPPTTMNLSTEYESTNTVIPGKLCAECGAHAVIKVDGCDKCTNCGTVGSCG